VFVAIYPQETAFWKHVLMSASISSFIALWLGKYAFFSGI